MGKNGADHFPRRTPERPEHEACLVVGEGLEPSHRIADPVRRHVGWVRQDREADARHPVVAVAGNAQNGRCLDLACGKSLDRSGECLVG